jgi:hypothetical protein
MLDKVAKKIKDSDFTTRSEQLKALAKHVSAGAVEAGLVNEDDHCKTVCEEQLVVVNGRLQRKVVCHVVCTP